MKVLDGQLSETHYNVSGRSPVSPLTGSNPLRVALIGCRCVQPTAPPAEGEGAAGNAYDLELTRTATLAPGSVTFVSGLAVYQVENTAGSSSFSLHLYSPPCAGLFCFSSA